MNKFTFATVAATALSAVIAGLAAPAAANPSGTGSAQDIINSLEASGYKVILNKLGDAPLDQATVVAVRPGREVTHRVTESGGDSIEQVLYTTVYVDVNRHRSSEGIPAAGVPLTRGTPSPSLERLDHSGQVRQPDETRRACR